MTQAPEQLPIDVDALDCPPISSSEHADDSDDKQEKPSAKGRKRTKDSAEKAKPKDDWAFLIELLTKLDELGGKIDELGKRNEARHKELLKAIGALRSRGVDGSSAPSNASVQAYEQTRAQLERVLVGLETRNRLAALLPKISRYRTWLQWFLALAGCAGVGFSLFQLLRFWFWSAS